MSVTWRKKEAERVTAKGTEREITLINAYGLGATVYTVLRAEQLISSWNAGPAPLISTEMLHDWSVAPAGQRSSWDPKPRGLTTRPVERTTSWQLRPF